MLSRNFTNYDFICRARFLLSWPAFQAPSCCPCSSSSSRPAQLRSFTLQRVRILFTVSTSKHHAFFHPCSSNQPFTSCTLIHSFTLFFSCFVVVVPGSVVFISQISRYSSKSTKSIVFSFHISSCARVECCTIVRTCIISRHFVANVLLPASKTFQLSIYRNLIEFPTKQTITSHCLKLITFIPNYFQINHKYKSICMPSLKRAILVSLSFVLLFLFYISLTKKYWKHFTNVFSDVIFQTIIHLFIFFFCYPDAMNCELHCELAFQLWLIIVLMITWCKVTVHFFNQRAISFRREIRQKLHKLRSRHLCHFTSIVAILALSRTTWTAFTEYTIEVVFCLNCRLSGQPQLAAYLVIVTALVDQVANCQNFRFIEQSLLYSKSFFYYFTGLYLVAIYGK